jgi:uncharacterized membrane protein
MATQLATQLINWMQISGNLFNQSTSRIIWNLFLAFIPLVLSFYLFRPPAMRNIFWWILLLIFIAFLPNAPYILTDSIHLIELSQSNYPNWAIILILIPQYLLFICLGFEAYVISLVKLDRYLANFIASKYLTMVNAIAHSLCIVGVYIGRFERFNSWDFVTKPGIVLITTIQDIFDGWKILSMAIAFIALWLLSDFIKLVNQKIGLSLLTNLWQ